MTAPKADYLPITGRDMNPTIKASASNNWSDARIVQHSAVMANDPAVRKAAELIHRNESLHRHDPRGVVCVYCAIVASRAAQVLRAEEAS